MSKQMNNSCKLEVDTLIKYCFTNANKETDPIRKGILVLLKNCQCVAIPRALYMFFLKLIKPLYANHRTLFNKLRSGFVHLEYDALVRARDKKDFYYKDFFVSYIIWLNALPFRTVEELQVKDLLVENHKNLYLKMFPNEPLEIQERHYTQHYI